MNLPVQSSLLSRKRETTLTEKKSALHDEISFETEVQRSLPDILIVKMSVKFVNEISY